MKTLFRLIVLLLLVVGWGLAALALHIVRTPERVVVIPKNQLGIRDIYADTRTWTPADLPKHADLVQRLVQAGKAESLRHVVPDTHGRPLVDVLTDAAAASGASSQQTSGAPVTPAHRETHARAPWVN